MDSFRDVSYKNADIYVVDSKTGKTKAVVDRFFSLVWTERYLKVGEFELSGPEDAAWTTAIAEGDCLHFTQSMESEFGRYTMLVESVYTVWDADDGYTVYANGRSLGCLLERRINMGVERWDSWGDNSYEEFTWGANPPILVNDEHDPMGWPYKVDPTADEDVIGTMRPGGSLWRVVTPFPIRKLIPDDETEFGEYNTASLIRALVDCNMGGNAKESRQFENFEIAENLPEGYTIEEALDGRFESVLDLVQQILDMSAGKRHAVGMRLVGEMRQDEPGSPDTHFHMTFELYSGADRTIDNADGNNPVIFARDWDNAITFEYCHGMANYRNSVFYDTGMTRTPDDVYELEQYLKAISLIGDCIGFETSPIKANPGDMDEDQREQYEERKKSLERLKQKCDLCLSRLNSAISVHGSIKPSPETTVDELDSIRDRLRTHRNALNGAITDAEVSDKRKKELDDEREYLDDLDETIQKRSDELTQDHDDEGYEEVYYGMYGRRLADPTWPDQMTDYWMPDAGPTGLNRREGYWQNDPWKVISSKWSGRFGEFQDDYDDEPEFFGTSARQDWAYFCSRMKETERRQANKEMSKEDTLEVTVNYNVMFKPTVDYRVGDLVTTMGIRNNEDVRVMRCDEMTYSIDASGYTIVPAFTLLLEDNYDPDDYPE